ncbi:hypothetical protein [Kamptonema formosum]|uniref:hypothetical protein n=1 Tax=Kamptonema formosum TaxID=331992 RepID=UPI0012DFA35E|nr:hypothetical protein [Oscillatoria sp. PCC 10802]
MGAGVVPVAFTRGTGGMPVLRREGVAQASRLRPQYEGDRRDAGSTPRGRRRGRRAGARAV